MKRPINYWLSFSALIFLLFTTCNQLEEGENQEISTIMEASSNLVIDKRVELFEIEVEEGSDGYILKGVTTSAAAKKAFLTRLDSLQVEEKIFDSIMVLPDPGLGEKIWALVNVSVCNIRTKPGHSQELTTQATLGTPVRVLQGSGSWYRIQTPDHYIAWVDDSAIHRMTSEEVEHWRQARRMVFVKDLGFVRSMTDPGQIISDLTMGCILELSGSKGIDHLVTLPDGRSGWVPAADLLSFDQYVEQSYPNFPSLFSLAKTFMGRPYLWGGTSPRGMDCSGYMKTLFIMNGAILSRDANQQALQGDEVSLENDLAVLQPGDLLFFGRKASDQRGERVSHVGLYLGEGRFIHSSGRVKINSFKINDLDFSEYLKGILLHARRVTQLDHENGPWSVKNHPWYRQ